MTRRQFRRTRWLIAFPLTLMMATGGGCMGHKVGGKAAEEVFPKLADAALANAACAGDREGITRALAQGANANARGDREVTPLAWAITCTNRAGVEALLKAGADPNATLGRSDSSLVDIAATYDDTELLRLLLRYGGDPDRVDASGETPLDTALGKGIDEQKWDNWYALLDAGFDINKVYNESTIVENAAMLNQHDKVLELLDRGYSHDLKSLARFVAQGRVDYPDAIASRNRLIAKLKSIGVPYDEIDRKYQQESEEARQRRAELYGEQN